MPETVLPQPPTSAPAVPSSTPPGGIATAPTPPATAPEWRAGETAPAWARGKTPEEILGIAQRLVDAGLSVQETRPAAASATPTVTASSNVGDDDFVTGRDLRAAAASIQPNLNDGIALAASGNLRLIQREYAKEFQRYGAEISAMLATVPKNIWTLDNLERVVKLVKSDHLDDLARERAQEIVNAMEPTIRSTGVGGSVSVPDPKTSLASEQIPTEWKERAARAGITEKVVQEFCVANEMTPEAFYKQFATPRTAIAAEIGKIGAQV